ncbi:hypothetical protein CW304_09215 [Bacillus sp. UFRGS-B20]|nr:hypothetical protein CW304_09215 [Bacillus sp. UFRGS-B20]
MMSFVIPEKYMSRVLTTVCIIQRDCGCRRISQVFGKEQNFCSLPVKGSHILKKAFQIANIGHITEQHFNKIFDLLEGVIHFTKL